MTTSETASLFFIIQDYEDMWLPIDQLCTWLHFGGKTDEEIASLILAFAEDGPIEVEKRMHEGEMKDHVRIKADQRWAVRMLMDLHQRMDTHVHYDLGDQ